jgi:hypothetical protein
MQHTSNASTLAIFLFVCNWYMRLVEKVGSVWYHSVKLHTSKCKYFGHLTARPLPCWGCDRRLPLLCSIYFLVLTARLRADLPHPCIGVPCSSLRRVPSPGHRVTVLAASQPACGAHGGQPRRHHPPCQRAQALQGHGSCRAQGAQCLVCMLVRWGGGWKGVVCVL